MQTNQQLAIRGSGFVFRLTLGISLACIACVLAGALWTDYELVYLMGFLALVFGIMAIRVGSQRIYIQAGRLYVENIFVKQHVELDRLVIAKHYRQLLVAQPARVVLELRDSQNGKVIIEPDLFDTSDEQTLAAALHPYVFRPSVEKNFITFWFGAEPIVLPPLKPRTVAKGVVIYVLLPSILITIALVIWALATNQPAFD